jgi:uncharacterized membrane protein
MNVSLKRVLNLFLIGVLAFIPIFLIVQIVLFGKDVMLDIYRLVYGYSDNVFLTIILFIFSFMMFTYIGYRIRTGKFSIVALIDIVIDRIPVLNTIYRVTKKIVNMFSGHDSQAMSDVVYVEYPKEGLWVPAYVTNKHKDMYVLFVPTSPNPTSGFTIIVHESKTIKSSMDIEDATSFIVSVGVDCNKIEELSKLPH